ncbi:cGMP-dependent protein kinase 1-like [Chrysoperla carnea]|uniref:cGMP-dependent protein kinase 1-like n=1 Tax=Chrysoperla carnea TaxID=189513 RepID=UPI001D080E27|nr:cGMP-dependent protein kinase 1-like [Chrysoperla carnea]
MLDFKGYAKLVDFGNAKRMIQDKTYTFCSMEYVAPEIVLGRGHNKSLDYWSLGVFISELLLGDSIFRGSNALETYQNVLVGGEKIKLPSKLTKDSQSIIRSLCKLHPAKRLGCQQDGINAIKNHRWFNNFDWVSLEDGTLKAPLIRPINGPTDLTNFYQIQDANIIDDATEDLSNWDIDF